MSLWEKFEKENCNLKNNNIRIRIDKGISKKLRKEYLSLIKYLRNKYVFPYRLNIYAVNKYQVKLMDGRLAWGKFHWYESKDSYIVIPSKIDKDELNGYTLEEEYTAVLGELIHELTHYFQWINSLTLTSIGRERQATKYARYVLDDYAETREHP